MFWFHASVNSYRQQTVHQCRHVWHQVLQITVKIEQWQPLWRQRDNFTINMSFYYKSVSVQQQIITMVSVTLSALPECPLITLHGISYTRPGVQWNYLLSSLLRNNFEFPCMVTNLIENVRDYWRLLKITLQITKHCWDTCKRHMTTFRYCGGRRPYRQNLPHVLKIEHFSSTEGLSCTCSNWLAGDCAQSSQGEVYLHQTVLDTYQHK